MKTSSDSHCWPLAAACVAACSAAEPDAAGEADERIVLGFSQIGAESEWRTANTESIKAAAKDAGIDAEVLRRAAEAGEPDQGDPLVHRAEGRRDRVLAGGRDRLGHRAARGQGGQDPGDPHRPRGRREGRHRCTSASSARTSSRKAARPAAGCSRTLQGRQRRRQHRRAAGHGRLGAGDRPQEGLRGDHHGAIRASRSSARRPATSRAPRARR